MNADEFQRLFNVRYSGHPTLFCVIPKPLIRSGSKPLEQFQGKVLVSVCLEFSNFRLNRLELLFPICFLPSDAG